MSRRTVFNKGDLELISVLDRVFIYNRPLIMVRLLGVNFLVKFELILFIYFLKQLPFHSYSNPHYSHFDVLQA